MKKVSVFIYLFICIQFCYLNEVQAKEKTATCITWRSLNSTLYEVTVTYYEECTGWYPLSLSLECTSSCFAPVTFTLNRIFNSLHEITPACIGATYCQGGNIEGINKMIFKDTIALPGVCNNWILSTSTCCTGFWGGNVVDGSYNIYMESRMNNAVGWENSSPVFISDPTFYVSKNVISVLDNAAYDPDGDSLVYSFVPSLQDGNTAFQYINNLSFIEPLVSLSPTTIDAQTGAVTIFPSTEQITIFSVLVSEYRNGILLGTIQRQQALFVLGDQNQQPTASGINGSLNYTDTIPALAPFCFQIQSDDSDSTDYTSILWDSALPNATYTTIQSQHSGIEICWTPNLIDTFFNPHCFSVSVDDNHCPYHGHRAYSFYLFARYDAQVGIPYTLQSDPIFSASPNPTTGLFILQAGSTKIESATVYNMLGEEVMNVANIDHGFNRGALSMDISALLPGIYIVQATAKEKVWRGKMVKE